MKRHKYYLTSPNWSASVNSTIIDFAASLSLYASVRDTPDEDEIIIEVQGSQKSLDEFEKRFTLKLTKKVSLESISKTTVDPIDQNILLAPKSKDENLIDGTICPTCEAETLKNNFYLTTCSACEPRYTITKKIPFTRENTIFAKLAKCDDCYERYYDSKDRFFQTQSICCDVYKTLLKLTVGDKPYQKTNSALYISKLLKAKKIGLLKNINGLYLIALASEKSSVLRVKSLLKEDKKLTVLFKTITDAKKFTTLSKALAFSKQVLSNWWN